MTEDLFLPGTDTLDLRDRLASGAVSAADLMAACLAKIEAREDEVRAWEWLDPEAAMAAAAACDAALAAGTLLGPLHGLPVGVKDVIDTAGIPTENGCPVDAGRVPEVDAAVVTRLTAAGAIMMGKTVTTELAFMHPNKTRNPHNPAHTPGGSSSGSAAAVAAGMIPLAIGTQTGGSVIRPASFCGITGFKPSFGAIPRDGVLMQSHSLDTLGTFANDLGGAALLAGALMDTELSVAPGAAPQLLFVRPPGWAQADPALHAAFDDLVARLGARVDVAELPPVFDDVAQQRAVINTAEMGHYYAHFLERGAEKLGAPTRATIEAGLSLPAPEYIAAKRCQAELSDALAPLFQRCDAILCPSALGPAPEGLGSTGDSIFNGLWTMAGTPAITLPLFTAPNGLPMGAQLVGPLGSDAALVSVAAWLWAEVSGA